ncbi:MAG: hypothetical protein M0020_03325 [Actinomycetota bacterium]|nr:hypothetical protein [Actinomycetota bacterium]
MPMREECKHFQSRTYSDGETARFCVLDLAPEAPWRCPDDCPKYERRLADVGWVHGSLVSPHVEDEPDVPAPDAIDLLDAAEGIVTSVAPEVLSEVERDEQRAERARGFGRGQRFRSRLPWRRRER